MDAESATCLVCGDPLTQDVVYCAVCGSPHHDLCFNWIGSCAIYGCGGKQSTRDRTVTVDGGLVEVVETPAASPTDSTRLAPPCELPIATLRQRVNRLVVADPATVVLPLFVALCAIDLRLVTFELVVALALVAIVSLAVVLTVSPRHGLYLFDTRRGVVLYGRSGIRGPFLTSILRMDQVRAVGLKGIRRWCRGSGEYVECWLALDLEAGGTLDVVAPPEQDGSGEAAEALFARVRMEAQALRVASAVGLEVSALRIVGDQRLLDQTLWWAKWLAYVALALFWWHRLVH